MIGSDQPDRRRAGETNLFSPFLPLFLRGSEDLDDGRSYGRPTARLFDLSSGLDGWTRFCRALRGALARLAGSDYTRNG